MEIINLTSRLLKKSFSLANNSFRLMQLEIMLAKKSLPVIAGLLFFLVIFIVTFWGILTALLVTYLRAHGTSLYHALFAVLAAHLALIIITALLVFRFLGHLKLRATRHHLQTLFVKQLKDKP